MNKDQFIQRLNELGMHPVFYPGRVVVCSVEIEYTINHYQDNKEYQVWNVFSYGDRGGRDGELSFYSESEAFMEVCKRHAK